MVSNHEVTNILYGEGCLVRNVKTYHFFPSCCLIFFSLFFIIFFIFSNLTNFKLIFTGKKKMKLMRMKIKRSENLWKWNWQEGRWKKMEERENGEYERMIWMFLNNFFLVKNKIKVVERIFHSMTQPRSLILKQWKFGGSRLGLSIWNIENEMEEPWNLNP